jgi:hypothetical protein
VTSNELASSSSSSSSSSEEAEAAAAAALSAESGGDAFEEAESDWSPPSPSEEDVNGGGGESRAWDGGGGGDPAGGTEYRGEGTAAPASPSPSLRSGWVPSLFHRDRALLRIQHRLDFGPNAGSRSSRFSCFHPYSVQSCSSSSSKRWIVFPCKREAAT